MIKIIISGTSDGFYPRYASDGLLDDEISQLLLDRRRFFSRDADRLYKEGYSFQQVAGEQAKGILYHKIILLYDGFGRDGFMMASIFLPEGEKLDGTIIKEALDALIRDYKAYTINGIANVEVDWSFVNKQAEELIGKVIGQPWKNRPIKTDASVTALIKGVTDSRVADYFQYPNPLNSICDGFGQVFLTESLLDPAMASEDGTQGYKVLTTSDMDIDNPEYSIEYENKQSDAKLSVKRSSIKKNELDNNTNGISLGTYSSSGYREEPVTIPAGTTSLDGETITVKLPTLKQKEATVVFTVKAKDTAEDTPVELNEADIKWSEKGSNSRKNMGLKKNKVMFTCEECDKKWYYFINRQGYEEYQGNVDVIDNKTQNISVSLTPKPLWVIVVQFPDGRTKDLYKDVPPEDLEFQKESAIRYLKKQNLDVEFPITEPLNHKVTIVGKKKETAIATDDRDPWEDDDAGDNVQDRKPDSDSLNKFFLILDNKSCNYSLFRNYREKKKLEQSVYHDIKTLKDNSKNLKTKLEGVLKDLDKRDYIQAKDKLESLLSNLEQKGDLANPRTGNVIEKLKQAVKNLKKIIRTPEVVRKTDNIEYVWEKHQIQKESVNYPNSKNPVRLCHDRYEYTIHNPKWMKGGDSTPSTVVRKLRSPYIVCYVIIGIIFVVACGLLTARDLGWFQKSGSSDSLSSLATEMYNCHTEMAQSGDRYCGDSLYNQADVLMKQYSQLSKEGRDSLEQIITNTYFLAFNEFEININHQTELKQLDNTFYQQGLKLLENSQKLFDDYDKSNKNLQAKNNLKTKFGEWENSWEDFLINSKCMTQQHVETLNEEYNKTVQKVAELTKTVPLSPNETTANNNDDDAKAKAEAKAEENKLYEKCMDRKKTSVQLCDRYLSTYNKNNAPAKHIDDVTGLRDRLKTNANNRVNKNPKEKPKIKTDQELWEAMIWDNLVGMDNFLKKYDFDGDMQAGLKKRAGEVFDAAQGKTKNNFENARANVETNFKNETYAKKLLELVKELKRIK